ncbi:MAG TPA: S41 family peptidase [Bacteroidota bacterium]
MTGLRVQRWLLPLVVVCIVLIGGGFAVTADNDLYLKIDRGITLFGRVYKEITANYVDEVDPEKFMEAGIDGMLGTLDPYTVYISKEEGDEVDLLTSGKYGGIGVTIGIRDGALKVINVMDGYSAQRQGIVPGDVLQEIDGVPVSNKKAEDVRNLTRGEPGTEVKVKILREGQEKPLTFTLLREEIQLHNVTYADYVSPGIGYIKLERFSRRAGEEVRQALKELKVKGELKGLVLDLRGNPGGLLDAAVDVAGKFLPKGSLVVTTRGREAESEKKYFSTDEPVIASVPMVVLTDRGSASASEIVAGALQDMDRAVIVGTRTFGKGLVQTILPLNYGAQLKITTARYYTPSGRCIQEIDYQHRDKNGVFAVTPDSLRKQFKTVKGRVVYERGGVAPDSLVNDTDEGPMVHELIRRALFFKFANQYAAKHAGDRFTRVTSGMLADFRTFLAGQQFDFSEEAETKIKDLHKVAVQDHYGKEVMADLDNMVALITREKQRAFDRYSDHITDELNQELASRYKGEKGRIEASLEDDPQLNAGVGLLKNKTVYQRKLEG